MKQEITFLIILLFNIPLISGNRHVKCCKSNQRIIEQNSAYKCDNNTNKRIQDNFKNTNFLSSNSTGTCIELYSDNKVAIFSVDGPIKNISIKQNIELEYFPKCCPVGYTYNTTLHSCTNGGNSDILNKFLKNDFIEIGLVKCEIISDEISNSADDIRINENQITFLKDGRTIQNGRYCIDATSDKKLVIRTCEENSEICKKIRCIHKCCNDGQSFINGPNCVDTLRYGVNLHASNSIEEPDEPFAIIHGFGSGLYVLNENKYNFTVDKSGAYISYQNKTESFKYHSVLERSYCMEYAQKGEMNKYALFAEPSKPKLETKFAVTRWVKILSCIFLILTICVYLLLPKMRNLFGKILLSYSVSTLLFFFLLSFSQFYYNTTSNEVCRIMGFSSVLASIWSFTWLHIMCIDIWFSFGTPRTLTGPLQKNEWKRFIQYSLYGWLLPALWVLMIVLFNITSILPNRIHPYVGNFKCYLENNDTQPGNYAYLLFITLPLLVQQIINSILFIKTIMYCLKVKAEIEKMNDARKQTDYNAGKERSQEYYNVIFCRLGLIMKLAVIMGVSFLFETISSMYNFQKYTVTSYIEVVWDTINCLQGVFIFIIFICKKKVYDSICERIPILKPRKTSVSSSATTQVSMHHIEDNKREKTP
ncbi:hypothetical protein HHI36_005634 [Cryptolaemus montrouzieri]|uniref:G-protein coupled receptors family 2 profile 2 domain-containing protein n=1 Tax=Cryptolaemus montrouzieri TaxID=559131 RepID=A0ABD2NUS6_9CUCU